MKTLLAILPPALALVACSEPANEVADDDTLLPTEDVTLVPETDAPVIAEGGDAIPGALRGRWGIDANDCDPEQAAWAKGLIDISDTAIRFYESRAELGSISASGDDMLRATFDMSGEGMEWQRDMSLTLENGGDTLVRREYGDDAMPTPLTYSRCPA